MILIGICVGSFWVLIAKMLKGLKQLGCDWAINYRQPFLEPTYGILREFIKIF